jgi:hypothetical protein
VARSSPDPGFADGERTVVLAAVTVERRFGDNPTAQCVDAGQAATIVTFDEGDA